ncbi:MAG: NAD-binding protein, partial [Candidatus Thiodiazotropha sp.]
MSRYNRYNNTLSSIDLLYLFGLKWNSLLFLSGIKPGVHWVMGVAIIGCGDIGTRLAQAYSAEGIAVTGIVRTLQSVERLEDVGVEAVQIDLDQPLAA